jgi:hypothetical protein
MNSLHLLTVCAPLWMTYVTIWIGEWKRYAFVRQHVIFIYKWLAAYPIYRNVRVRYVFAATNISNRRTEIMKGVWPKVDSQSIEAQLSEQIYRLHPTASPKLNKRKREICAGWPLQFDGMWMCCESSALWCKSTALWCESIALSCESTALRCESTAQWCESTALCCESTALWTHYWWRNTRAADTAQCDLLPCHSEGRHFLKANPNTNTRKDAYLRVSIIQYQSKPDF